MSNKYLQDSAGNKSSKRLAGFFLLGTGIIFAIIAFIISIYQPLGDSKTALKIIEVFLISGGGLLGIGVFEQWRKR